MSKDVLFDQQLREQLMEGVNCVADAVRATLGPRGRNVLLEEVDQTQITRRYITNDGATIAKNIDFDDPVKNMGAQLLKEVAARTNTTAGDGTTTAVVLAQAMISEGVRMVAAGFNPILLRKGILNAAAVAAAGIKKVAVPVKTEEEITSVATISSGDPALGALVGQAVFRVGQEGVVTVDTGSKRETELILKDGMQLDHGFLTKEFTTDANQTVAEIEDPYILITDEKITNIHEILPLIEEIAKAGASLVIIAEEVSGSALSTLTVNKLNGILKVCVVRPPAYGDGRVAIMEDLAFYTGGEFISKTLGHTLRDTTLDMLGRAQSVRAEKDGTAIVGGAGGQKAFDERVSYLRNLIEITDYEFNQNRYKERLARFVSGTAVLEIGGDTELEINENKMRAEDAVQAARAAVREGIVPGGGCALLDVLPAVEAFRDAQEGDIRVGADIMCRALTAPAAQIAFNAGHNGDVAVIEARRAGKGIGFDADAGTYRDMMKANIIDPALVTRMAIFNAASLASTLLTTDAGVTDLRKSLTEQMNQFLTN